MSSDSESDSEDSEGNTKKVVWYWADDDPKKGEAVTVGGFYGLDFAMQGVSQFGPSTTNALVGSLKKQRNAGTRR